MSRYSSINVVSTAQELFNLNRSLVDTQFAVPEDRANYLMFMQRMKSTLPIIQSPEFNSTPISYDSVDIYRFVCNHPALQETPFMEKNDISPAQLFSWFLGMMLHETFPVSNIHSYNPTSGAYGLLQILPSIRNSLIKNYSSVIPYVSIEKIVVPKAPIVRNYRDKSVVAAMQLTADQQKLVTLWYMLDMFSTSARYFESNKPLKSNPYANLLKQDKSLLNAWSLFWAVRWGLGYRYSTLRDQEVISRLAVVPLCSVMVRAIFDQGANVNRESFAKKSMKQLFDSGLNLLNDKINFYGTN